jgi:dTDP-4-amino-4,6-dideoxygalactose transaminase
MFSDISWLTPPGNDLGCQHVYYVWAARIINNKRKQLVTKLNERGFPMREGYTKPLNYVFDSAQTCHITEETELRELITFEVCRWNPTKKQRRTMEEIVKRVTVELV